MVTNLHSLGYKMRRIEDLLLPMNAACGDNVEHGARTRPSL